MQRHVDVPGRCANLDLSANSRQVTKETTMGNGNEVTIEAVGAEWRVARTEHECVCGKTIKKGVRYFRLVQKVDGVIETTKEADHTHAFEEEAAALDAYWESRYEESRGC